MTFHDYLNMVRDLIGARRHRSCLSSFHRKREGTQKERPYSDETTDFMSKLYSYLNKRKTGC